MKRAPSRLRQTPEPKVLDDHEVAGDLIRLMWDYGVEVPSGTGRACCLGKRNGSCRSWGLSFRLATAVRQWGRDVEKADAHGNGRFTSLNHQGEELFWRLRDELASRYEVHFLPWWVGRATTRVVAFPYLHRDISRSFRPE